MMRRALVIVFLLLLALPFGHAKAHPHVWIEAKLNLTSDDEDQVTGIDVAWTFDEFFSAYALLDLGGEEAGPEDLQAFADGMLADLQDWGYFTFLKDDDLTLVYDAPEEARAVAKDGLVTLYFHLPLQKSHDLQARALEVQTFDPSYYVAITLQADEPLSLSPAMAEACMVERLPPQGEPEEMTLSEAAFANSDAALTAWGALFAESLRLTCP